MTWTLGISAFYHDSAAALLKDGEIIAAAQEERFTRIKHDASFPVSAIACCLEQGGIGFHQLNHVVFYEKPLRKLERMVTSFQSGAAGARQSWLKAAPGWSGEKLHVSQIISDTFEGYPQAQIYFSEHHLSHAASAFYPSPFEEAAILVIDGVGEWATASIGTGKQQHVSLSKQLNFPDSLGLLYSAVTAFCGFKVNSGEYKLMGLAPYGKPVYLEKMLQELVTLGETGDVTMKLDKFAYVAGEEMFSEAFAGLFGGPARAQESPITRREMDLAASIQALTEIAVERMARFARDVTGMKNLCLAGGVALNCVANGKLLKSGLFDRIWIQPAAGDAGCALGAALAYHHGVAAVPRKMAAGLDHMKGSYLGPKFSRDEVRAYLRSYQIPYRELDDAECAEVVASALAEEKIVGFFNGRMEFGPRSLGARSILGNPLSPETQKQMNLQIKYRESFRPFAPAVLAEDASQYFEIDTESPYMLLVAPVCKERCLPRATDVPDEDLLKSVSQLRSDIPAVTHWDYSARVQTVHAETNPLFHQILEAFKAKTGCSVLVNTSFNVRGEPIVCTPDDAFRCFVNTDMDFLFIEGFWLDKSAQPEQTAADRERWRNRFDLD